MADKEKTGADAIATVEAVETAEVKPTADMSGAEIKEALTVTEDAKLHPAGKPSDPASREPGGAPSTDPDRPPYATSRPDEPILTSLATGSGAHTPPDPATVDADGYVRPLKAEENA